MSLTCNIFKDVWDTKCDHKVGIVSVLNSIKNERWEKQISAYRAEDNEEKAKNLKFALPCVTFSGVFKNRKASDLIDYSGVIVIDIDNIPRKDVIKFKNKICNDPYTFACFISPSYGLKVLFITDIDSEYHKEVFNHIREHFSSLYNITVDRSGKDVSRLCFVSSDKDLYMNTQPLYYSFNIDAYVEKKKQRANHVRENFEVSYDSGKILETCVKWVRNSAIGRYAKGNRNNFIHALACCLNRAGMAEEMAMSCISGRYTSLEMSEIETTVKSAYRNNPNDFGTKPIYIRKSDQNKLF